MARILVIDDDADLLHLIRIVLEGRGGHHVQRCADGADGLAQALADPPDLAIVDVMMPGTTGYDVCQRLRASPATASIPIIVLSARSQAVDQQAAIDAGADDFASKPVPMMELLERVNRMLAKPTRTRLLRFEGQIVLLSLRGGVGVTTLAVNLAAVLAQPERGTVCLIDLCPSSGHVALQLGLRPDPNWSKLVRSGDIDENSVKACLLRHEPGLQVLASPFSPTLGRGLSPTTVRAILGVLETSFSTIVIDTPSALSEATMAALEMATAVVLVATADAPSIQTTLGTLHSLKPLSSKLQVVSNEVTPGIQASPGALERTLKRPLLQAVPFDAAQARALAQGIPLTVQNPQAPLAQAVQGLAQGLARATQGGG